MLQPTRAYQDETIARMDAPAAVFVALDPGLGKTRCSIELAKRRGWRRLLVFCPASARMVWAKEIAKWWPDGPTPIQVHAVPDYAPALEAPEGAFIASYDCVSRGAEIARGLWRAGKKRHFDALFLDEAHFLKTSEAFRTDRIYSHFAPLCERIFPLSGTPAVNHAGELYTHLRNLAPETIKSLGGRVIEQWEFEERYCVIREPRIAGGRTVRSITGSKNIEELRRRIAPFIFRRRKKDVLPELPPIDYVDLPIECETQGLDTLDGYADILQPGMSDGEVLEAINSSDANGARLRVALGIAKAHGAVRYLQDFLSLTPVKIIVFAHHKRVLDIVHAGLRQFGVARIDGDTSPRNRERAVEDFVNNPDILVWLGQTKACGTAITLLGPKCQPRNVFFVEAYPPWGDIEQAASRPHRIGQLGGVLVRFMSAAATPDERAQETIARRMTELSQLY